MSDLEAIPEGEVRIPFSKFGTWINLRGQTLNQLARQDGGLLLIAEMARWAKIDQVAPGLKGRLLVYLAAPAVKLPLRQAEELAAAKRALTRPRRATHAEQQRSIEYGM